MNRHPLLIPVLALALVATTSPRALPGGRDKRASAEPAGAGRDVEVRYANGSTVLMSVVQDRIEVVTAFGKLTVPTREIRSIEFGLRVDEPTRRRIDVLLAQLGSPSYRERELAMQALVRLGPQAYPAVQQAARGKDGEAGKRAETALQRITQKVPARLLRTREEDRVRTTKFTIVGRVLTPAIRARAEYFGELELKAGQMLSMRWLQGAGETEVTVDAARYGSAADQWLDTGVQVEAHVGLKITAAGQVDLWPQQAGQYMSGPEGMQGAGGVVVVGNRVVRQRGNASGGALMGRIGESGTPFVIGQALRQVPTESGKLYLHITPSPWGNASAGSYTVRITAGANAEEED